MSLSLDLSTSHAKVDRAFEHLKVLEGQIPASVPNDGTYKLRFGEINQQTGWCDVILVPSDKVPKPRLGVLLGDIMHNLRCALDYIVTALVDASHAQLMKYHQFPIFPDRQAYRDGVGTSQAANAGGPLRGIIHGLAEVQQFQPYHRQPNPREHPLWHLYRFSNADKHREVAGFLTVPGGSVQVSWSPPGCILAEFDVIRQVRNWSPDKECVIARLRFIPPYPSELHQDKPIWVGTGFTTPAFGGEPEHSAHIFKVRETCECVRAAVRIFEQI